MATDLVRSYVRVVFGVALLLFSAGLAQANSDVTDIKRLIESQNIEKAFERIKEFQAGKPKLLPEVQLLFGDLYLALEQPSKANEYFEKTLFSSTQFDDSANAGMAEAHFALGNLVKAETLADKALKQNPDQIRAKLVKGAIVAERGNLLTARKLFQSAMKTSQTSTLAGRKFVKALMRQNLLGEAEEVLKDTLISNSFDAPSLELYSELLFFQQRFDMAIEYRIDAEEKYRSAGNTIKANEMLAWLNLRGRPELKPIEKPKETVPVVQEPVPASQPIIIPDLQPLPKTAASSPNRKAFPPLPKPEPIFYDDKKPVTTGSGVILKDGLWILTNRHVAEDMEYAIVRNGLGETRLVDEIMLSDNDDLAVLVLEKPFPSDYSLSIEDFKPIATGEDVYVMGYPMASIFGTFHPTITTGIASNPKGFGGQEGEFQMTAKINPGNSGGPIFNKYGEIVGLATGGVNREEVRKEDGLIITDIGYGVTAERAVSFLNRPIPVSLKSRFEYSSSDLYKYMRSGVVFIVGQ